jgi:DNA polymerase
VAAKKFGTALDAMNEDSRLRGGFRFFGAHTGRWAGRGVQPHNLPREQLDTELDTEMAILDLLLTGETDARTLKALVRALFVGPFTVSDYSSIEARVISWLAGEQWALDAFYAGRDIYVETAKRMGGLTRSQGKVAVLALGFNGGIKSLQAMGAQGDDGQLQFLVDQWRAANPAICAFWKTMGEAFRLGGPVGPHITIEKDGSSRYMRLPSGRAIGYHDCRFEWTETRYGPKMQPSFRDSRRGWQQRTYGGRLSENATQAVARDILAEALVRVDAAGHAVVGHVHDEMIVEGEVPLEELTRLMTVPPDWADGLPIDAAGFSCRRYRKG